VVQSRESTEGIVVSVADNGPGVPRGELPHLLDPVRSKLDPAHRIGLGIAAAVVRAHGGQFWVESVEGRGTAYFLRVPRAENVPEEQVVEIPPYTEPAVSRTGLTVLIADDESSLRLALELFLARQGHRVVHAANAHDALRLAQQMHLDAALVDARMPGDGIALVDQLEEIPALHGRVALMSGDVGYIRSRQNDNPNRLYIAKPFEMNEVVNLIEQLGR
jgi:two-component system, cell cycle sensor histidine kinase and response regulator CckA